MPELPEVEIARRQLERWAAGRRVDRVIVADPSSVRARLVSAPSAASAEGAASVAGISGIAGGPIRHGKRLGWVIGDQGLLIHLGMTGSWVRRPEAPPHARLGLAVGEDRVWFDDPRRFGCVVPVPADEIAARVREDLGPDALDEPLGADALADAFGGRGPIKPALLDQARLAGLGNIHAVEALWRARIAPHRPGRSLSSADWAALADAIPRQLADALEDTDDLVYINRGGDNPFAIYGREGEACPRCGAPIARTILGGRSTFHCPACQPA